MSEDYEPLDQNDEKIQQNLNECLQQKNFEVLLQFMLDNFETYEFQISTSKPSQGNTQSINAAMGIINNVRINQPPNNGTFMVSGGLSNGQTIRAPMPYTAPYQVSLPQASLRPMAMNNPSQVSIPQGSIIPLPLNQPPGTMNPISLNRIPLPGQSNIPMRVGQLPLNGGKAMPIPLSMMNNFGFQASASTIPFNGIGVPPYRPPLK